MAMLSLSSTSNDWRAQRLALGARNLFTYDGRTYESLAGFAFSLRFNQDRQRFLWEQCALASGAQAERLGRLAERHGDARFFQYGMPIAPAAAARAIREAIRAMLSQHPKVEELLKKTAGYMLVFDARDAGQGLLVTVATILEQVRDEALRGETDEERARKAFRPVLVQ